MLSVRQLTGAVATFLILGTLYRLWPIVSGMPALGYFFLTEDGYLMLTVARNMAIGLGMTVSDGTIPTNGVQPMAAILFATPYVATGGDKVASLVGIHLIQAATAVVVVFAVRAFTERLLSPRDSSLVWPWAAALTWFLGPLLMRHSMNGLETSLYTLFVLLTLFAFGRVLAAEGRDTLGDRLRLGVVCGLTVLARNDAVFLVAAVFVVWAIWELFVSRTTLVDMLRRLTPPGLMSIAVASPWLLNNQIRFGSIVPVSGTAQQMSTPFGSNLPLLPAKLFEHAFPMLPVPSSLESTIWVVGVCVFAVATVLVVFLWRVTRHMTPVAKAITLAYLTFGAILSFYYGTIFGAPHFLSRYLAPVAPLLIVAALAAALEIGRWLKRTPAFLAGTYSMAAIILSGALLIRALLPGVTVQGHEQVVAWMEGNVPEQAWIAAVQTGTLGYWHDQTFNLDGKVNPEALAARRQKGHVLDYVTDSEIDYVIDWYGIAAWVEEDTASHRFAEAFEIEFADRAENIAVLKRKDPRFLP